MMASAGDERNAAQRVAEHIKNTPDLWRLAESCIAQTFSRDAAARQFVDVMHQGRGQEKTPAGDRYTQHGVKLAMQASSVPAASELANTSTLPTSENIRRTK